jgi:hypothetical protein
MVRDYFTAFQIHKHEEIKRHFDEETWERTLVQPHEQFLIQKVNSIELEPRSEDDGEELGNLIIPTAKSASDKGSEYFRTID